MELRKIVENQAKQTLGYEEAEDKKSFMTGVGVAISILEDMCNDKIKVITNQASYWETQAAESSKDTKTIAKILKKYIDEE